MTPFSLFFEHQRTAMFRFIQIEERNGFGRPTTFLLQDHHCQALARRYAWQITEEVCEALDVYGEDSFQEEVADVYHFLIELLLVMEMDLDIREMMPNSLEEQFELRSPHIEDGFPGMSPLDYWTLFIQQLGMTMNRLKNRPWRIINRPTDRPAFLEDLRLCFIAFYHACDASDVTPLSLTLAYSSKSIINEQRYKDQISGL